jgi:hypothetical protein
VQRRVVAQILPGREVGVQRALLEHHAHQRQRPPGFLRQVAAEHPDVARLGAVEPGDQREQRGLAGAVLAKQDGEGAGPHRDLDLRQDLAPGDPVGEAGDGEGGGIRGGHG